MNTTNTQDPIKLAFDAPGPQITKPEYGPEPSLREVLEGFYAASGMTKKQAETCAAQYIAAQPPGFTAHDMATAAADGFRDGVASTQASEPSATRTFETFPKQWKEPVHAPARAVEPLTQQEIGDIASLFYAKWRGNEPFAHAVIDAFCRKNGITTTPAAKAGKVGKDGAHE